MNSKRIQNQQIPKIWFRADGNVLMGLGHIVRSSALAAMLKNDFIIHFVSLELDETIKQDLLNDGFQVTRINSEEEFIEMINQGEIVVLDGYQFGTAYQKLLKSKQIGLVCIDDIMDKEFYADLIINQAPNVVKSDYQTQSDTEFALGIEYCLLRKPFIDSALNQNKSDVNSITNRNIDSVFICFGGSDAQNLTVSTYKLVKELNVFDHIILVTGASYENRNVLENLVKNDSKTEHYHHINAQKMAELMSQCAVKIVPGSGILYEAFATGGIVISGYYTDNQIPNYHAFLENKAIIGTEKFESVALRNAIAEIDQFNPEHNIIDGKSPGRFKKVFLKLHKKTIESVRLNSHQETN